MPEYHFNSYNGSNPVETVAMTLSSLQNARKRAVRLSGLLIESASHGLGIADEWRMEVTDDKGLVLLRIDFTVTHAPAVADLLARRENGAAPHQA